MNLNVYKNYIFILYKCLEQAKFNQANRFTKMDLQYVSDEEICTLTADDFDYEMRKEENRPRFGFGE